MEKVRIGLIGAGVIGGTHSAVLRTIADAMPERLELVAVADPSPAARQLFVDVYGYRRALADGHELVARADVDTVFVCTPTVFHADLVRAVAAAGKQLFCEKPLAMSLQEAEAMLDSVRRAGIKSQIGLVLRFSAVYAMMRELLRDPAVGAPVAVLFRDDQVFPVRGVHDSRWRADRRLSAGGTLIEHGVHDLDLLTWLFGPVARLRAWQENRAGHPGIEDYVAVELEFASGLRAQLVNVWHDMLQRPSNRRLEIFCQRGFIASDHDMIGDVLLQIGDGAQQRVEWAEVLARFTASPQCADERFSTWFGIPYFMQDLAFVTALLDGRDPSPGLAVGVDAQRLADAVYRAAASGEEIAL